LYSGAHGDTEAVGIIGQADVKAEADP